MNPNNPQRNDDMNYKFPRISNINDVLPAIEGYPEFNVIQKDGYKVINYNIETSDTFKMVNSDDVHGAIRRECRGLIFDDSGKLISRAYHKFFNINQHEETLSYNINISIPHIIMEKLDGSMIRPFMVNGNFYLGTKMGVTEVSLEATKIINYKQINWLKELIKFDKTPILEYISPSNKIVVSYEESKLILTAVRDNWTGEYISFDKLGDNIPFEIVPSYGSLKEKSILDYVEKSRKESNREGDVIRFSNGHMVKCKNDWYVSRHKAKDEILSERNILKHIMNSTLDDIIPLLDKTDHEKVDAYSKNFGICYFNTIFRLNTLFNEAIREVGPNKKDLALKFVPKLVNKEDGKFLYILYDNKNLEEHLDLFIMNSLGSNEKYQNLMKWMEV
jgi:RNA ligase